MVSPIEVVEHFYIPISDDIKLSATLWIPKDAAEKPVPAILEYLPYRRRDGTIDRDEIMHPYLAEHGYACLRVDMRGCGESNGLLKDEYLPQEQQDCLKVLEWIAKQPWCTGKVGMMGISWGGFNSLQVAKLQPKELAGVVSLCSTDDRWHDIHFDGGVPLTDNFQWSHVMAAIMSQAPDSRLLGETWREEWLKRLEDLPFLAKIWFEHPLRDEYWKQGSICEDYSAIQCPVYLVGGWADGYHSRIFDMLSHLTCQVKGLIGPWAHKYPHMASPGPQIGFLQELLRWWDQCLKGIDTGIYEEPQLRVWMQDSVKPKPWYDERPGRWVAEERFPSKNQSPPIKFFLKPNKLSPQKSNSNHLEKICTPQTVGEASGAWMGYSFGPERPSDQRVDDSRSLCFDTKPLEDGLEILGSPTIKLRLTVDQAKAFVCVRLNDVFPTGESLRITHGLLNLNLRHSFEQFCPIVPNEIMEVTINLNACAHSFPKGHKIRISISTTYWPMVWPSFEPVTLGVAMNSRLKLPQRLPQAIDNCLKPFEEAITPTTLVSEIRSEAKASREITRNVADDSSVYTVYEDYGEVYYPKNDLSIHYEETSKYSIKGDDPKLAKAEHETEVTLTHGKKVTKTKIWSTMKANATHYLLKRGLFAWEDGELIKEQWVEEAVSSTPSLN